MRAPKNRLRVRALRSRLYKMRFFIDGKTMQTVTGDSRIGKALKAPKPKFQIPEKLQLPNFKTQSPMRSLVWCLRNNYTFVALKLAWGEARGRECIPSDTRPTEQRSPRPISAQPQGRHVFWAEALLLAPYRSTSGYARRSRLASAHNPLLRMYSYFGDTTLAMLTALDLELGQGVHEGGADQSRLLIVQFVREARFGAFAGFFGLGFINLLGANRHVSEDG